MLLGSTCLPRGALYAITAHGTTDSCPRELHDIKDIGKDAHLEEDSVTAPSTLQRLHRQANSPFQRSTVKECCHLDMVDQDFRCSHPELDDALCGAFVESE